MLTSSTLDAHGITGRQGILGRRLWVLLGIVLLLIASCLASVAIGARAIPLATVLDALANLGNSPLWSAPTGEAASGSTNIPGDWIVVWNRVPRTIAGVLVGACLALAGTAMQGITRNPLADPGILGLNAGAALAIVLSVVFFQISNPMGYIWFAFLGAAVSAIVVYSIASVGREGATPVKLALAGAALSAGIISLIQAALLWNQTALNAFRNWNVGSLAGVNEAQIMVVLPFMLCGIPLLLSSGRWLNGLVLGDDLARGLGQNPVQVRSVVGLGVVLLCGAATALAGPIAFIGLVVPHLLRTLIGPDYRWLLWYSLPTAPLLLLLADVIGRVIALPGEVPAGVLVVFMGAPVFIALVRRRGAVTL